MTTAANEGGLLAFTQLIAQDNVYTKDDANGTQKEYSTNGQYMVDGPPQYAGDAYAIAASDY